MLDVEEENLLDSQNLQDDPPSFICDECGQTFNGIEELSKHMTNHMQRHAETKHEINPRGSAVNIEEPPNESTFKSTDCVICPFCMLQLTTLEELKMHIKNIHNKNQNKKDTILSKGECAVSLEVKLNLRSISN